MARSVWPSVARAAICRSRGVSGTALSAPVSQAETARSQAARPGERVAGHGGIAAHPLAALLGLAQVSLLHKVTASGYDRYSPARRAELVGPQNAPLAVQAGPVIFGDPDTPFTELVGLLLDAIAGLAGRRPR
jgi:hypothetical protein